MRSPAKALRKNHVAIVDDHPLVREALMELISRQPDLNCTGTAETTAEARRMVETLSPDLLILDLRLKSGDALDLMKTLRAEHPEVKVLVLSQYDELIFAERVLRAGACGYVMKENATEEILQAIQTVLKGEIYFSNRVGIAAVHRSLESKRLPSSEGIGRLSDRELQVLQFIGAGFSVSQIAKQFGVSVKTVETHRDNIKIKLNMESAAELHSFAEKWVIDNLLPLERIHAPASGKRSKIKR
jgi:DNA-binding NarL/FixJ family response regulator